MDQHKLISYIKSMIRITGLACILMGGVGVSRGLLSLLAGELVGIIEEMVV